MSDERPSNDTIPDAPEWRSAQVIGSADEPRLARSVARAPKAEESDEVIDKAYFFDPESRKDEEQEQAVNAGDSNWVPTTLRLVPAFYPLEKSSRLIEDELPSVATRISECLRLLSVQAIYNNHNATASLMTGENVEMHLALWRTPPGKVAERIVVELQRRKGCSIIFHRYSRHILDAAVGDIDLETFAERHPVDIDRAHSKKVERLISRETKNEASEQENAIIAIEIAHGLLMKDRMDARQLGLESLCLLTDPSKTGTTTAVITSRVVLLGTACCSDQEGGIMFDEVPFQEIRERVLSLVQVGRIVDEEEEDEGLPDNLEGILEEKEHLKLLHNLALAVMANALDVIENYDSLDTEPEQTEKKMPARGNDSASSIALAFMNEAKDITKLEIVATLIGELGKAGSQPHDACLSAKCLFHLFGSSKDARRRARQNKDFLRSVLKTALEVGTRTHAKLETECKSVVKVLEETAATDEE